MKKIYLATIAVAVITASVGGIILTQFNSSTPASNGAATSSQNHPSQQSQSILAQNGRGGADGSGDNFGPPDDGGFGSGDQLLG